MSAPQRVSGDRIVQALQATGGNIRATARETGISRTALRKRMVSMGLEGAAFRSDPPPTPQVPVRVYAPPPRRPAGPVRVHPDHAEALRQAAFDLAAKRRTETTATDVLAEFMVDAFEGWLRGKLA